MKRSGPGIATRWLREIVQVGLAVALTLGAMGAGYVAGRTSGHHAPAVAPIGETDPAHAAEAGMEGLLLLLLGRGGVL